MLNVISGKIFQLAYVVPNIDEAVASWAQLTGAGPFVVTRHQKYVSVRYQGEETKIDVSLAFAFSGDMNIELIEIHNDNPCVYADYVRRRGYGLQHIGALSNDIEGDTSRLTAAGVVEVQRNIDINQTETRFFETESILGTTLELIKSSAVLRSSFGQLKAMAESWDGAQALIDLTPSASAN